MFDRILIANRGEIACRVIKTARRMGIKTVAVFSDADRDALHVRMADEAIHIGPPPAAESYISMDRVLAAIRESGAQAVHPGYGFLSERAEFARALEDAGVAFIGPPASAIEAMGDKITSKKLAREAGVSTVPGHMGLIADADEAARIAAEIGFPVMIKASAGGGGKGMRIARNDREAREGFQSSRNEAKASFGDDRIFIEKFVEQPRHIEIQVLGDAHGTVIHLGERECSIQRRNQKVIEEAPSPFLDPETRAAMGAQAVALAQAVGYRSAGTVEFIVDAGRNFYFLEMNTRLQVEHPVTELVTGIDLVEQMIRVAAGQRLAIAQEDVRLEGWAIESRLYAEDPYRGFLPSIGRLTCYRPPDEMGLPLDLPSEAVEGAVGDAMVAPEKAPPPVKVRNDTGVYEGGEISRFYDPMIAKLCSWGPDRPTAIETMREALDAFELEGIGHNLPFLAAVMDHPRFNEGRLSTAFIAEEYPDGFNGAPLGEDDKRRLALVAAAMRAVVDRRAAGVSGAIRHHRRRLPSAYVVTLGETRIETPLEADGTPAGVDLGGWAPGATLARATVEGRPMTIKVDVRTEGFRLRWRGAEFDATVRPPRLAALADLMPAKGEADTARQLLCPMPGLVTHIAVAVGDEVQEGQALATVEAMKMENVLRAERKGRVKAILAAQGASLAVDDVIMEFE